ncbi:MAG: hypothetical protein JNG82_01760 [Opitutaceae bacterium]|nr:hypothetical protein [Opitutaceae bacterium]
MKPLTILLPDSVFAAAANEAKEHGVDVPHVCIGVLSDHFLALNPLAPSLTPKARQTIPAVMLDGKFGVADAFTGFPHLSIELAQRFTDEAQRLGRVRAYRNRRGIGFDPNFVFIEYLMSRSGGGIGVSFYGEPHRHANPPEILVKGIPSYSRAKIYSVADLDAILPHIRQAYELKFGSDHTPVQNSVKESGAALMEGR